MTCIIAIGDGKQVVMGGERGNSDSGIILSSSTPKIIDLGHYLYGYAGLTGPSQLIAYRFTFPPIPRNVDMTGFMLTEFIPSLRSFCQSHEINPDKEEDSANILIGARGRVYEIDTYDFQCVEYEYSAIGSGREYALGSLYTQKKGNTDDLPSIVSNAVSAAIHFSPTCQGPVDILIK